MTVPHFTPRKPCTQDLTGKPFGRLVVLAWAGYDRYGASWLCECLCGPGTFCIVLAQSLLNGHTKSCGCLRLETTGNRSRTHGLSAAPEFYLWHYMVSRCHNPRDTQYKYYGGRGISVCERWRNSAEAFLADMAPRPSPLHTLDRIDNMGNYEPGNVRWATRKEQAQNRRSNVYVSHDGMTKTLAEWADYLHMPYTTLKNRFYYGWSVQRVLTTPVEIRKRSAKHNESK